MLPSISGKNLTLSARLLGGFYPDLEWCGKLNMAKAYIITKTETVEGKARQYRMVNGTIYCRLADLASTPTYRHRRILCSSQKIFPNAKAKLVTLRNFLLPRGAFISAK
jgi:hypothetical protein